jgi:large subunit ribosomal protein L25
MSLQFFSSVTAHNRALGTDAFKNNLKKSGNVLGVIYSKDGQNLNISINLMHFEKLVNDPSCKTRIFELALEEKKIMCILKEVQFCPIKDIPLHFDMQEVSRGDKLIVSVPVRILNKELCPGLKRGGDVYVMNYNVKLKCVAEHIPTSIDVDVQKSQIGDRFKLSSISLPEKCQMIHDALIVKVTGKKTIADIATQNDGGSSDAAAPVAASKPAGK